MTIRLLRGVDIESGALVLVGDADSFKRLAHVLRTSELAVIELDELTGRPVLRPIDALYVEEGDGPTTISVSGHAATLRGSAESRARLADEIELFLEHNDLEERGMHSHVGVSAHGEQLLAVDSRALILAGLIPDDEE